VDAAWRGRAERLTIAAAPGETDRGAAPADRAGRSAVGLVSTSFRAPTTPRSSPHRGHSSRPTCAERQASRSHYGYFAPFGFDLTPYLKPENLLVSAASRRSSRNGKEAPHHGPVQRRRLKPYPASAYSSLADPYRSRFHSVSGSPSVWSTSTIAVDWLD